MKYKLYINRVVEGTASIIVEARSPREAEKIALEQAPNLEYTQWDEANYLIDLGEGVNEV